jgi:hypothetical protein
MDLRFLERVPAAGIHISVHGVSPLPDPIQQELPRVLEVVKGEVAGVDAFDATLAEPVGGSGGLSFDVSPRDASPRYMTASGGQ